MRLDRPALLVALLACRPAPPTALERAYDAQRRMPAYDGTTRCSATSAPRATRSERGALPASRPARLDMFASVATRGGGVSGATRIEGALSAWDIDHRLRDSIGALRACFARELAHDSSLAGRIVVDLTIAPDGEVADAVVTGLSSSLDACLCRTLAGLAFPRGDAPTHVSYPLLFDSGVR